MAEAPRFGAGPSSHAQRNSARTAPIEALSRGAAFVRFTDLHRGPIETIKSNLDATKLGARAEARRDDAFAGLRRDPDRPFDYIYIAPPQYKEMWVQALKLVDEHMGWLTDDGTVIAQIDPSEYQEVELKDLAEGEQRKYGSTLLIFYDRK